MKILETEFAIADKKPAGVNVAKSALSFVDHRRWNGLRAGSDSVREELLDRVPAMPSTALGLEMLLFGTSLDLRAATELVLDDVGATIQVLRLVGREYGAAFDRPSRMGECLSGLAVDDWFEAIARASRGWREGCAEMPALWTHCRLVARYAQFVAESMESVMPEDAYLVGLLHGVDALPGLITRGDGAAMQERSAMAALQDIVPLFVQDALRRAEDPSSTAPWRFILNTAHELSGENEAATICGHGGLHAYAEGRRGMSQCGFAGAQ